MTKSALFLHEKSDFFIQDMERRAGISAGHLTERVTMLVSLDKSKENYTRVLAQALVDKGRDLKLVQGLNYEAHAVFQEVLLIEPDNADAHYYQAWLDYFKDDIVESISHFESAISQQSLDSKLRVRAQCQLALLYCSIDDLEQAALKVKQASSVLSTNKLEQDRELTTIVDMTVFMIEQAQTIAGKIVELAKPVPYLALDAVGEHALSHEAKEAWIDSVKNNGHALLDLTEKKPHIYIGDAYQVLNENESTIIQELMRSGQPLNAHKIVDVLFEGSIQAPSVKKSISRIRNKVSNLVKQSEDIICTVPGGYLWNEKYPWQIVKINYFGDVE